MGNGLTDRDWEILLPRIKEGRCTPFLGAGAAYQALPLGADIARQWSRRYDYPLDDTSNLPRVAQYLAVHYDAMFPKERLVEAFKGSAPPDFDAPDDPHGVLASLPLPIYMTTNYDDFMLRALQKPKLGRFPVREIARWNRDTKLLPSAFDAAGFSPTPERPVVFHLHGQLDVPKSMVLTEDDYLDFLVRMTVESSRATETGRAAKISEPRILPPRIEEAFTDASLLFLGYGLADWDFRVLFRALVEYLERSSSRSHVSVQLLPAGQKMSDAQKENVQRYFDEYFKRLQIHVFWGTCGQFVGELGRRWNEFRGGT